jgi:hypothetical protein
VERDQYGNYQDGWPIGYEADLEFPQHKSLNDRLAMAAYSKTRIRCLRKAKHLVVEPFDNPLHNYLGVWPEQAFVISRGRLVFRCDPSSLGMSGHRNESFAEQIEAAWPSLP